MRYNANFEADQEYLRRHEFTRNVKIDTVCEKRSFALNLAVSAFLGTIAGSLNGHTMIGDCPNNYELRTDDPSPLLVQVTVGGAGYLDDVRQHNFDVTVTGGVESVTALFGALKAAYGEARLATVTWWYEARHGSTYMTVPLEPPQPLHDELYPWLEGGVEAYLDRFLADRASVLFLMGGPGTGKTSLLRHLIYSRQLAATITYEEKLLSNDELFVNFLCNTEAGVLVIEDADLLVGSRESEGNKLISRFLNVSDGLIKTSGKKIVFTTNLGDFRNVDPALVRSGRCFDAVKFRALTREEAAAAAARVGVPDPGLSVTLAELFGRSRGTPLETTSVGF